MSDLTIMIRALRKAADELRKADGPIDVAEVLDSIAMEAACEGDCVYAYEGLTEEEFVKRLDGDPRFQ